MGRASARVGRRAPPAHCTISLLGAIGQAPGATAVEQPLYLCGARLTYFSAILPITDGLGLAFAVTRCDGRVIISPTSCRELIPDPEAFAQCLRDSFQEYLALAQAAPAPRPATERATKRAKAPRSAPAAARPSGRRGAGSAGPLAAPPRGGGAEGASGGNDVRPARPRASVPGTPRRTSRTG